MKKFLEQLQKKSMSNEQIIKKFKHKQLSDCDTRLKLILDNGYIYPDGEFVDGRYQPNGIWKVSESGYIYLQNRFYKIKKKVINKLLDIILMIIVAAITSVITYYILGIQ